ncbi:hypothetical protein METBISCDRAFT_24495 [Metschnikowia bicuspidata]|uniref:Chromatin modification-related protein EAF7 n=1 Tax=Metschnikowia bicuspidata TaxID=27322 RepID=A0A4P9Z8T9_9ASCO|nr:hypothetical protein METBISCDRAFT_24495 [Metschnikowia bicuspidata]
MALRQWTVEAEIKLFSLICEHKPAGPHEQHNLSLITQNINDGATVCFTQLQIVAKLDSLYNMANVDRIEADVGEGTATDREPRTRPDAPKKPDADDDSKTRTRLQAAEKNNRRLRRLSLSRASANRQYKETGTEKSQDVSDAYSSELSDVDGEGAMLTKLKTNDPGDESRDQRRPSAKPGAVKKEENEKLDAWSTKESKPANESRAASKRPRSAAAEEPAVKCEPEVAPPSRETSATEPESPTELRADAVEPPIPRKRTRSIYKLDSAEIPKKPVRSTNKKNQKGTVTRGFRAEGGVARGRR